MARTRFLLPAAAILAGLLLPPPASAQPPGSIEARVQAMEARVAALEGRTAPSAAAGPACRRLNVNGSRIPPGGTLSVSVDGKVVATYDEAAYGDLEPFSRPALLIMEHAMPAPRALRA